MKYRVCILAILAVMTIATANADNWKSMNFRRNNSTTSWSRKGSVDGGHSNGWNYKGSSNSWNTSTWNYKGSSVWWNTNTWNYHGTELRGVTHGGGRNPYKRNQDRTDNSGWDFSQVNRRQELTTQNSDVSNNVSGSYSFNISSPADGRRVCIVTSKTFAEGTSRYYVGHADGGSTERTYRYAPKKNNYGENMASSAKMVAVKQSPSSLSASGGDDATVENDKNGLSRIGRGGGDGPVDPGTGGPSDVPLGNGLAIMLLLTGTLAVWKMKSHI